MVRSFNKNTPHYFVSSGALNDVKNDGATSYTQDQKQSQKEFTGHQNEMMLAIISEVSRNNGATPAKIHEKTDVSALNKESHFSEAEDKLVSTFKDGTQDKSCKADANKSMSFIIQPSVHGISKQETAIEEQMLQSLNEIHDPVKLLDHLRQILVVENHFKKHKHITPQALTTNSK